MRCTIHAEEKLNKQDAQRWGVTLHSFVSLIRLRLTPFSSDFAVHTLFFPFV